MKDEVQIAGVGVNLNSPDVRAAKSVEDLQKLEIFSHLNEATQKKAYDDLLKAIQEPAEEDQAAPEE